MFEVGKKYTWHANVDAFDCVFSGNDVAVLRSKSGGELTPRHCACTIGCWEEYIPPKPLTFVDLKVGEKFKWVITRGHEDTIYLKCRGVTLNCTTHLYTTLNGPLVGHTFGNSNDDIPANEVIRAE